jgi:2-polyprenyl-6-methoxyphenol hydroxylase-like FAD-dependent oxidoreductase
MTNSYDVIVIGARVAGAATAMLLARAGARVLCVDRTRRGSDTLSTHALMRGGVAQLQRWGLLTELEAAGTPPVRRTVFHYGTESSAVSIKPAAGVDALYAPRRTVLDALLVDAATAAGATFEFGVDLVDLSRGAAGEVTGAVLRDRRSGTRSVVAPLVIGADGARSAVAQLVRAPLRHSGSHASAILYGYWSEFPSDGYEWFYQPQLTAGTIPTNGGLTCVFVGGPPARVASAVRSGTPATALGRLATAAGLGERLACAAREGTVRSVRGLQPGYLRAAAGNGWALVGDAGHWLDPMSTHGMTAALRDAELLARAVLSPTTSAAERRAALAGYQAERDRLSLPMMGVTDEIASYTWDLNRIRGLLRQLASAMTVEVEALVGLQPAG